MPRIEKQDADQEHEPFPSLRDEAATRCPAEKHVDLKKQSQFAPAQSGVTSFVKEDYDNKPDCGDEENKANQSQIPAGIPSDWEDKKGPRGKKLAALRVQIS